MADFKQFILDNVLNDELCISNQILDKKHLAFIAEIVSLRVLKITVTREAHQRIIFLNGLPNLRQLVIKSGGASVSHNNLTNHNWLNFANYDHYSLTVLELVNVAQSKMGSVRSNWFETFANLTTIKLEDCLVNANLWNNLCEQQKLTELIFLNVKLRQENGQTELLAISDEMLQELQNNCTQLERVILDGNTIFTRLPA